VNPRSRALLLSLALCLSPGSAQADPQGRLESGRKALESGDHERAAADFAAGLEEGRHERDAAIFQLSLELANVYATFPDLGHEADAEKLYLDAWKMAQALTAVGSNARIATSEALGTYYSLQGRHADAIAVLEQWLKEAQIAAPPDRLYRSQQASMLREAYSAVGDSEGAARMRALWDDPAAQRETAKVAEIPRAKLYVEPNAVDARGAPIFLHFDPTVVPLRVSIGLPKTPASDASPEETRAAAIDGMREWETAIRRLRPDFRIDFERDGASAPIQVAWSERPPGYTGGSGTVRAQTIDGATRTIGTVVLSTQPLPGRGEILTRGAVYTNAIHAFGGALGLGYCQDCDSVRSMGWKHRDGSPRPTDLDLRTLEALLAIENGTRAGPPPSPGAGVLADLPFVNTGDDRHIYVDIAKPGSAPFVVQLDTGAAETVMTPLYARALGVAARKVKSDQHRRDSVTGKPVLFWVTDQFAGRGGDSGWAYALLGGSYLESYVVEVDVPRRRVRLLDPKLHAVDPARPRPGEQITPIRVTNGWPLVEVGLGNGSSWALLDTGAMGSVMVSQEAAARLGIEVDPNAPRRKWRNVLGTSEAAVQRVAELEIGAVRARDVEIDIGLRDSGVRIERIALESEMLIGLELMRRFVVRIDYPNQKLGLTPIASDAVSEGP
jgi:predicted aspartyl protease